MKRRANLTREEAEGLAIQALAFIAGDGERLGRFLAVTGIGPAEIRAAAREPGFLIGVLDYMSSTVATASPGVCPGMLSRRRQERELGCPREARESPESIFDRRCLVAAMHHDGVTVSHNPPLLSSG